MAAYSKAAALWQQLRDSGRIASQMRGNLRIPTKANADSEGNANGIPAEGEQSSERSDAGISIVQEVFAFVKRNLSGAQRRKNAASGERGAGKGAAALVPAPAHRLSTKFFSTRISVSCRTSPSIIAATSEFEKLFACA